MKCVLKNHSVPSDSEDLELRNVELGQRAVLRAVTSDLYNGNTIVFLEVPWTSM